MTAGELFTAINYVSTPKQPKERRKRLKALFRKMRKTSEIRIRRPILPPRLTQDVEPIILSQRVVFRSQGEIPVKTVLRCHDLLKYGSIMATRVLSVLTEGEPTDIRNGGLNSALRHFFEEQMKTMAQLVGLFPPEPEVTLATQELFEQFFESQGLPNEAESDLLQAVGYVDAETLEAWFTMKLFRLRGFMTIARTIKQSILQAFDGNAYWREPALSSTRLLKPYSRH